MTTLSVVPGDGIGPEVVAAALTVLEALSLGLGVEILDHVRASRYRCEGHALDDQDMERLARSDAILLGAVGEPALEHTDYVRSVLFRIRETFDLYANVRPVVLLSDRLSPLRDPGRRAIDCIVVRENSEGLYSGAGGVLRADSPWATALDVDVNTRHGVARIIEHAMSVSRGRVCMVDKANAVRAGGGLWSSCWAQAVAAHPEVECSHLYADAAALALVDDPTAFDTIVTSNSWGDVLSDLTAGLAGGLGIAPSANINPQTGRALFEPVHGSAPDIAGLDRANPIAAISSLAMALDHVGFADAARAVRAAVQTVAEAGRVTADLGGTLGTRAVTAAIVAEL